MAARDDRVTALSGIAGKPWAEYSAEAFTSPVDAPAWSGGSASDLPADWVARNAAENRAKNYVYKPFSTRRTARPRESTIRMLPRPVRQRRRVRRVAARPVRRARAPGRRSAEPHPEPLAVPRPAR
jgi:hypothetical protein